MRKQIHGWILATVLGSTGGVLAQDGSYHRVRVIEITPTREVPVSGVGGAINTAAPADPAVKKMPRVIEMTGAEEPAASPKALPAADPKAAPAALPPAVPDLAAAVNAPPADGGTMWAEGDFLLMWAKSGNAPPFLGGQPRQPLGPNQFTAPIPTSPGFIGLYSLASTPNALNRTTATEIRGGHEFSDPQYGGRLVLGTWLDGSGSVGVELGYSYLRLYNEVKVGSAGSPELALPFIDANTGLHSGYPIAQAGVPVTTRVFVNTTPAVFVHLFDNEVADRVAGLATLRVTGSMNDVEGNAVFAAVSQPDTRIAFTAGLRYLQLNERLLLATDTADLHREHNNPEVFLGLPGAAGTTGLTDFDALTSRRDHFDTTNHFYGGQVGARGQVVAGDYTVGFGLNLAVGDMAQTVRIYGENASVTTNNISPTTTVFLAGIPLNRPTGPAVTSTTYSTGGTGIYAQPSNSGTSTRNILAFIPQGNLKVGYRISDNVTATLGYSFMYINNVARPGDQIDYVLRPDTLGRPATGYTPYPRPLMNPIVGSDFWLQGVELGLQMRY